MSSLGVPPTAAASEIGDGGVGKTSLVRRFVADAWELRYIATIGVECHYKCFEHCGYAITVQIWDTAGPEKFGGLRDGYYIGADCCAVCYDTTSRITAKHIPMWIRDATRVAPGCSLSVIGCKSDLVDAKQVHGRMLERFARKYTLREVSSKDGTGVSEALRNLVIESAHRSGKVPRGTLMPCQAAMLAWGHGRGNSPALTLLPKDVLLLIVRWCDCVPWDAQVRLRALSQPSPASASSLTSSTSTKVEPSDCLLA